MTHQSSPQPDNLVVREITVFFPFYNEERNIENTTREAVKTLERLGLDYEIILVDDGSRDRTGELADALAAQNQRIRVIHHGRNRGYGAALQSGFRNATKEWVFYTDGDLQFDISQIELLLPMARDWDIVNGYRMKRQDNVARLLYSSGWNWLVKRVLRFKVKDVDSAFKLYRREIFSRIEMKSTSTFIDAEILARAAHAGYSIGHVGVRHLPRRAGKARGASPKVVFGAFKELLALRKDILGRSGRTP